MAKNMIRHGTANLLYSLSANQVEADLDEITPKVDILGCQEVWESRQVTKLENLKDFTVYWPNTEHRPSGDPGRSNAIPIIFRTKMFTLINGGWAKGSASGGSGVPARYFSWVILKHKTTGDIVVRMNTHFTHQAWTSHPERRTAWNHHRDAMMAKAKDLANKWGSVIGAGDMNRDHYSFPGATTLFSQGTTYSNKRYDYFFIVGRALTHGAPTVTDTHSDHNAVVVNIAAIPGITPHLPTTVPPKSEPPGPKVPPPIVAPIDDPSGSGPPPPVDGVYAANPPVTTRPPAIYIPIKPVRDRWRYIAQQLTGDGSQGEFFDFDIPLQGVSMTENLSGFNTMSGTIAPENRRFLAPDGEPLLTEYGAAIWADNDGEIRGGGILRNSTFDSPSWAMETIGYTGYADKMPWVTNDADGYLGVGVDPTDVVRVIWDHIQSQPGGDLGLEISDYKTGIKIGLALKQGEFDTINGPLTFESGPVQINWYSNHDLGETISDLAASTPFDFIEHHYWDAGAIRHELIFGYPSIGRRRTDLRFAIGENVFPIPTVSREGDDYASEILVLGAGDGRAMIRGSDSRQLGRLRRVATIQDSGLPTIAYANARARAEMAWRANPDSMTDLVVHNAPHAPLGSYGIGDEIYIEGRTGWRIMDAWFRITSITETPDAGQTTAISVVRSDRLDS